MRILRRYVKGPFTICSGHHGSKLSRNMICSRTCESDVMTTAHIPRKELIITKHAGHKMHACMQGGGGGI